VAILAADQKGTAAKIAALQSLVVIAGFAGTI